MDLDLKISVQDIITAVAVLVAAAGVAVAIYARRDANRSAEASEESAKAAKRSAKAAEDLTAIEQQRLHTELTPRLSVQSSCPGPGAERIKLTVGFDADNALDRLDHVEVRVRDDSMEHRPMVAGGPTQEQLDATIWGPYRFVPGIDGADALGRAVPARPLLRGESRVLSMEASLAPSWTTTIAPTLGWRAGYADQPIRLELTCIRAADPPWVLKVEVEPPRPKFATSVRRSARQIEVTATNIGTSYARDVRFGTTAMLDAREATVLEVGRRTTATITVTAAGAPDSVELHWIDRLGVACRQPIDL